ncbi:unnamed protein product [Owenia fusiformis]|uniref:Uncharacterized protein n=1 Tax=Owenia fusiformis TaxID=6347 RepID=A0A8S4Q8B9_OWEFU|nr:unnamed protein product [Owenia fusiformis]
MENFYSILECKQEDPLEVLKTNYQQLVLKYHPDKYSSDLTDSERNEKLNIYIAIDKAWKVLSDPEKRSEFDAKWTERNLAQEFPIHDTLTLDDFEEQEDFLVYPCRCGGDYILTETDIEFQVDVVCCESCTLAVKVLYTNKD